MFAVIHTGGKQYKVAKGDTIEVETLADATEGKTVDFKQVLLIEDGKDTKIGTPIVEGATVKGKVLAEKRADKIRVFKMKPKKRYQKTQGHRQDLIQVEITDIKAGASTAKAD